MCISYAYEGPCSDHSSQVVYKTQQKTDLPRLSDRSRGHIDILLSSRLEVKRKLDIGFLLATYEDMGTVSLSSAVWPIEGKRILAEQLHSVSSTFEVAKLADFQMTVSATDGNGSTVLPKVVDEGIP
eukprot:6208443-Pleurochrysis_carterae.AAC.4